jgi:hypothetical protein
VCKLGKFTDVCQNYYIMLGKGSKYLIHAVAQLAQLVDACPRLHVRVVPSTNRAHAGWLIPRVTLCAVLKIRVGAPRAVHTDVACCGYVGTPVRFTHHRHDGNARGRSHWLGTQPAQQGNCQRKLASTFVHSVTARGREREGRGSQKKRRREGDGVECEGDSNILKPCDSDQQN